MEKQRVNDAVVRLGNLVVKGRTFVVHRLSAKIRELRRKSETKFQSRIDRLLLEIAFLKTLSNSRTRKLVSRRILLSEDDHNAHIQAEHTTPDQRAFHRLCREKCVAEYVAKFREDNIDWKYWVPPLVEMWEKKQQIKAERGKKTTEKVNKEDRPSVKELVQNIKLDAKQDRNTSNKRRSDNEDNNYENVKRKKIARPDAGQLESAQGEGVASKTSAKKIKDALAKRQAKPSAAFAQQVNKQQFPVEIERSDDSHEEPEGSDEGSPDEVAKFNEENDEELNTVSDAEHSSESGSEPARQPFRPYAPAHTGHTSSDDTDGGDDGSMTEDHRENHGEQDHNNGSENEPGDNAWPVAASDRATVRKGREDLTQASSGRENSEDGGDTAEIDEAGGSENASNDAESDADEDDNEDDSTPHEEVDESGDTSAEDSDSESDTDALHRKQLLLEALKQKPKDSNKLEIDFSVQKKLKCIKADIDDPAIRDKVVQSKIQRAQDKRRRQLQTPSSDIAGGDGRHDHVTALSGDDSSDEGSDEGASFFLLEGEMAKDVPSKTIPKEQAPGLNRRERRRHDKRAHHNAWDNDIEGNGERFEKTSQPHGRFQKFASRGERIGEDRPDQGTNADFRGKRAHGHQPFDNRGRFSKKFDQASPRNGIQSDVRRSQGTLPDDHMIGSGSSHPRKFSRNFDGQSDYDGKDGDFRSSHDNSFSARERSGSSQHSKSPWHRSKENFKEELQDPAGDGERSERKAFEKPRFSSHKSVQRGSSGFDSTKSSRSSITNKRQDEQPNEALHPSWAAKKRLSAAINQPFQGKKIVFDDN